MLERQLARKILQPIAASLAGTIEYQGLEENVAKLDDLLDERTLLVVATNHCSHSDVLVGIRLVDAVRSRFPQIGNLYIPVAASLVRGTQGPIGQLFYSDGTLPLLDQHNITPLALVTENDQGKRNLKPQLSELKKLHNAIAEENSAFVDLTEGSVESGRYDCLGHERGIQEVTNTFLPYLVRQARKIDKKVVVLPAGISGTNSVMSAESLFFTWYSIGAMMQDWLFNRSLTLARATVGLPYEYPPDEDPEKANDIIMNSIALLKPIQERGYYHPATRNYQQAIRQFEDQLKKERFGRIRLLLLRSHLLPPPGTLRHLAGQLPLAT